MDTAVRQFAPAMVSAFGSVGLDCLNNVSSLDQPGESVPAVPYIFTSWVLYVVGGASIYFILGAISYYYYFVWKKQVYFPNKNELPTEKDLADQIGEEIRISLYAFPMMALFTIPFNYLEYLRHDLHYDSIEDYGWTYFLFSPFLFLIFADTSIYWIHRALHHPLLYKPLHKRHHTFRITTPFSSHAFHPFDGWLQASPYMLFAFFFPFHKTLHLVMFIGVNIWTVSIHDRVPYLANSVINSSDHHDVHHRDFIYNYGQYFCFWDRLCDTYKNPHYLFKDKSFKKAHRINIDKF
mmetsp:Transcript_24152/g.33125  ORF Transcript_24152/g.33125 Transcript_24152/m.33125 type:complete len:294 (-) Transcript_24152:52-933(-)